MYVIYAVDDICPFCNHSRLVPASDDFLYCPGCDMLIPKKSTRSVPKPDKVVPKSVHPSDPVTELDQSSSTVHYASGAKRGHNSIPYHFIHPAALMSVGVASAEGEQKYGAYNNLKGFPLSTLYDHAFEHILKFWWLRDPIEDDLGHAIWNLNQIAMQLADPETYSSFDDRPSVKPLTQTAIETFTSEANDFKYKEQDETSKKN